MHGQRPEKAMSRVVESTTEDLEQAAEKLERANEFYREGESLAGPSMYEIIEDALPEYERAAEVIGSPRYEESEEEREVVERFEEEMLEVTEYLSVDFDPVLTDYSPGSGISCFIPLRSRISMIFSS